MTLDRKLLGETQENKAEEGELGIYSADKISVLFMSSSFTSKKLVSYKQKCVQLYTFSTLWFKYHDFF